MLANSGLITARHAEACFATTRRAHPRRPSLQTFQDVGLQPATDQIENPAIADLVVMPKACSATTTRAINASCGIVSKYD